LKHPDAELDMESDSWEDNLHAVVKYTVYIPNTDPRLIELHEAQEREKEFRKMQDAKMLEQIKKRSPELFK